MRAGDYFKKLGIFIFLGIGRIHTRMVKKLGEKNCDCEATLSSDHDDDPWKRAKVTLIFKKGTEEDLKN